MWLVLLLSYITLQRYEVIIDTGAIKSDLKEQKMNAVNYVLQFAHLAFTGTNLETAFLKPLLNSLFPSCSYFDWSDLETVGNLNV